MPMTFYDRSGKPVAYTEDDVHIFLYSGYPVGYLYDGSVYSYSGRHLGTLRTGWIRDHAGACVFFTDFTEDAMNGGPPLPAKLVKPPKLLKKPKPAKGRREAPPPRADDAAEWSAHLAEKFFIS
jgi:hypothetical protein